MAVRSRWCLLALPLRIKESHQPLLQVFGAMPGVLVSERMVLPSMVETAGTRLACSDSGLAWTPEGMEESRLKDLSLGSASGVGRGTS